MAMENSLAAMFASQYADAITEQQASCTHTSSGTICKISHKMPNGEMWVRCVICGTTWRDGEMMGAAKAKSAPDCYQRRLMAWQGGKKIPVTPDEQGGGWKTEWFGAHIQPATLKAAQKLIDDWNDSGMLIEYRLITSLPCSRCKKEVKEIYQNDLCFDCHLEDKKTQETVMPPKKVKNWSMDNVVGFTIKTGVSKPMPNPFIQKMKTATPMLTPLKLTVTRKEGDIWELPKSNSPMWTQQWGYQGSAKEPYIVSHKSQGPYNTNSVTPEGWACSCKAFTRNMPRVDCKHIVRIKLDTGVSLTTVKKAMASLDDAEEKAFAEWKRQQAAAKTPVAKEGGNKLNLFGNTGRKFR